LNKEIYLFSAPPYFPERLIIRIAFGLFIILLYLERIVDLVCTVGVAAIYK